MKTHFFKILTLSIVLSSCSNSDDCGPTPPCAPPAVVKTGLNFQLLDAQGGIIDLKGEDATSISLTFEGFNEDLVIDPDNNKIYARLLAINFETAPKHIVYTLITPFGATQNLNIEVSSEWQGECQFCKDYFISGIIQNGKDTLFLGRFDEELIQISIK